MRKILLFLSVFYSSLVSAQFVGNGFYRVRNLMTERYIYVTDNTGSINMQAASADMGAIQTWTDFNKAVSDPASVIYIEKISASQYDLQAQGTGVHSLIDYYVQVYETSDMTYKVYAEGKYLMDSETNLKSERGYLNVGTAYNNKNYFWNIYPFDGESNYFGVKPTLSFNGRYFKPFYADFAFSFLDQGMKAWYVSKVTKGCAVISLLNTATVADNTPVIIECESVTPSSNRLSLYKSAGSSPETNCLNGVYFQNRDRASKNHNPSKDACTVFDARTMRVLGIMSDGRLGFITPDIEFLPANEAYLTVPEDTPAEIPVMTEDEYNAAWNTNVDTYEKLVDKFEQVSAHLLEVCSYIDEYCSDVADSFADEREELLSFLENVASDILSDLENLSISDKYDYYTEILDRFDIMISDFKERAEKAQNVITKVIGSASKESDCIIYDLSGNRIHAITKPGIYLVNNRKVVF